MYLWTSWDVLRMLNLIVHELLIIFPFVYPQQPASAWHGYIEDDLHPSQVG